MLTAFLEAIRFLTLIPLPFMPPTTGDDYEKTIARSMAWFPAVGLLIGAIGCVVALVAGALWNDLARAVAVVVVIGLITSGLHLDGLSDTFDAMMSWRPRERKLEIMKDSRIGSMGVLAIVFVLLLKWTSLSAIPAGNIIPLLILSSTASRASMSVSLSIFPYARQEGIALAFMKERKAADILIALLMAAATAWLCMGWHGLVIAAASLAAGLVFSACCMREIKGITGDTLGAVSEIGEMVSFLTATAIIAAIK